MSHLASSPTSTKEESCFQYLLQTQSKTSLSKGTSLTASWNKILADVCSVDSHQAFISFRYHGSDAVHRVVPSVIDVSIAWRAKLSCFCLLDTYSGSCVIIVLLDSTAAFDTVDLDFFISCLEKWVGIRGRALERFRSHLKDGAFCVCIGVLLCTPLPQGSILGPLLFSLYFCHLFSSFANMVFLFIVMQMTVRLYLKERMMLALWNHYSGVSMT